MNTDGSVNLLIHFFPSIRTKNVPTRHCLVGLAAGHKTRFLAMLHTLLRKLGWFCTRVSVFSNINSVEYETLLLKLAVYKAFR